ncbi:MAG TPA: hypothetical protein GXZ74_07925 [Tissierellia bacterium]|nr:hypothetical protein [Tissierellia bacterium]
MSYKVRQDKKRRRFPWRFLLVLILLLAIFGGGMKLGVIPGGQHLFGSDGIIMQEAEPPQQLPDPIDYLIVVSGNEVLVDGQPIEWNDLEAMIEQAETHDRFSLQDDQAIKETYERVTGLLRKHNHDYTETE